MIQSVPSGVTTVSCAMTISASVAGPPSPRDPWRPLPAMVQMFPRSSHGSPPAHALNVIRPTARSCLMRRIISGGDGAWGMFVQRTRVLLRCLFLVFLVTPALADRRTDDHSYAEPAKVRTKHLELDLTVDFRAKQLVGTATLDLEWTGTHALVLDTRDLKPTKTEALVGETWKPVKHALAKRDAVLGSKLTVEAAGAPKIRITYRTSPGASGLQ